jgi:prepilin signal peptidase PulO-like enzyme (type II secretory pathway)
MFWAAFFVFLIGLCVGSFLNVVVFRTHDERSVIVGRSKCLSCEIPLRPIDLIPVLSWIILRGRCRNCNASISWQYPAVELSTGLLFLSAYLVETDILMVVRDWIFIAFLTIIFVYDLRYTLILDRFSIPGMIVAVVLNLWLGVVPGWSMLAGGAALGGFFLVQHLISKGAWVGGGDIRMGLLMGFMLGIRDGFVALFLAYAIGACFGIFLLAQKKANMKTQVPFGTFLAVGTLIGMFSGQNIVDWYLGLLM